MSCITAFQAAEVLQKRAGFFDWWRFQQANHANQGRVFNAVEDAIKSQLKDEVRRLFPKTTNSYRDLKNALSELKYEAGLASNISQPIPKWAYTTFDDRINEAARQLKDLY